MFAKLQVPLFFCLQNTHLFLISGLFPMQSPFPITLFLQLLKWLVPVHPWGLCKSLVLIIKIHFFSFLAHRKLYKPVFLKIRPSHVTWPVLANYMKTYVIFSGQKPLRASAQVIFSFIALATREAYVATESLWFCLPEKTWWTKFPDILCWTLGYIVWREINLCLLSKQGFPCSSVVKESTCNEETWVWSLGWEAPLEKGKATHSSILA